jgi:hypothetical protein
MHGATVKIIKKSLKGVWLAAAGLTGKKPLVEEARLL